MKFSLENFWQLVTKKWFWPAFFGLLVLLTCFFFRWGEILGTLLVLPIGAFTVIEIIFFESSGAYVSDTYLKYATCIIWILTAIGIFYVVKKRPRYKLVAGSIIGWFMASALVWWLGVWYLVAR